MRFPTHSSARHCPPGIMVLAVLLSAACGRPDPSSPAATASSAPQPATADEVRPFSGDWTTTGTRQILDLGPGHQAGIFSLSGTMFLQGKQRVNPAFQAQAIGLSDTTTGTQGRSVWTDTRGDRIFSELSGDVIGPGKLIEGRFTGGTGRYSGITGEYRFKWQRMGAIEGEELTGRVVDLSGWVRFGQPPAATPATAGGQK